MPDTIGVDIVANEKGFIKGVNAASKAMADLNKQETKGKANAGKAGKALAIAETKAIKSTQAAQKKKSQEAIKNAKQQEVAVKKFFKGDFGDAFGLGATGVIAGAVVVAIAAGAAAAVALTVALASAAAEAGKLKAQATGNLNVLTNGRGAEALKLIDSLAESTGMKFQVARDRFQEFRRAGADNKVSAQLLKLTADLDSIDSSGKLSAEAIEKVLSHKDSKGNIIIKDAAAEMALLAKQAHVAGDGTAALAARFTTLGGATNSLDNSKVKFFEAIWDRVGPAIDKAAGSVAKFVDEFLKSEKGEKLIAGISSAIEFMADLVVASLPFVEAAFEGVFEAIEIFVPMFDTISEALGMAFGGEKTDMLNLFKDSVKVFSVILGGALSAVMLLVAAIFEIPIVITIAMVKVAEFAGKLFDFATSLYDVGKAIVQGLIQGISDMAGALWAKVTGLADGIKAKFRDALSISSPSKVFEQYGKFTGQGFESGLEKSAPDAGGVAEAMIPKGATSPGGSANGGGGAGGGIIVHLHLGQVSGTPDEVMRAARREFEMAISALKISRGVD
jgi:hypothetical protein